MKTTAELCTELITATASKRALDADLKDAKQLVSEAERGVLDRFEQEGIDQMRIGGQLVYLHRQLWAGAINKEDRSLLIAALKSNPASEFLVAEQVTLLKLSAWARELATDNDGMPIVPEHLVNTMEVNEVYSARVRKS